MLKEKIDKLSKGKHKKQLLEQQITDIEHVIENDLKQFLEEYNKYTSCESLSKHEPKIKEEIEQLENELEELEEKDEKIKAFDENQQEIELYNSKIEEISNLKGDEENLTKKVHASNLLKNKIVEAESVAISNVIRMINVNVQNYIDIFFRDVQKGMSIEISSFKENCGKPQINLKILNGGDEMDLNMLSGGELQRVIIAFNLTLCDIFNCPFLLLDEVDAPLDDKNIIKFGAMLEEISELSQVAIITHNKATMKFAKQLIGVTSRLEGISEVVPIDLPK